MNDANREEPARYVPLATCDFIVDLDTGAYTNDEPNYARMVSVAAIAVCIHTRAAREL